MTGENWRSEAKKDVTAATVAVVVVVVVGDVVIGMMMTEMTGRMKVASWDYLKESVDGTEVTVFAS